MTKEEKAAYNKAYYLANKEKRLEQTKAWKKANPEKCSAASKAHYLANKEKCLEQTKAWKKANPEKCSAANKAWNKANPERCSARSKAYYLRLNLMNKKISKRTLSAWSTQVRARDNACLYCGSISNLHAHHILSKVKHPDWALFLNNGITLCEPCHIQEHTINGDL